MRGASLAVETERDEGGHRIAEATDPPGASGYGETRVEAVARVEAPALSVLADHP